MPALFKKLNNKIAAVALFALSLLSFSVANVLTKLQPAPVQPAAVYDQAAEEFDQATPADNEQTGISTAPGERGGTWYIFDHFDGLQTKYDASKIADGANANGQNTTVNDGDRISIRPVGYELFPAGTASGTAQGITSLHTFRKRTGENVIMRSRGTVAEYFEEANDRWEVLDTGFTNNVRFGYADYNINTDLTSYVYFGNGQEAGRRWNGAHTLLNGALAGGEGTITVDDTTGFTATGTLIYCETALAYSGKSATTFTVPSAHACDDNRGVAQAPTSTLSAPRGNIYMTADNRLWIAGITTTPQAAYFSRYGDATDFSTAALITDGTDASPGIFNLGEGGGAINAMIQDESAIYLFKKSAIRKATLNDTTYTLSTLKPFDGKSQTAGAVTSLSTFTSGNEVFFITADNQLMRLARLQAVDYPQIVPISDPIKPTIDDAVFTSSTGIVFKDKAYFAGKSSSAVGVNDAVFVYNLRTGAWDAPIVGWNVGDFAIYDDGTGEALYIGDALTTNVYKITDTALDDIHGVTANWRSKQLNFALPNAQKQIDSIYIEGYIASNTTLSISLLLDEDGYTQTYTTNFAGTEDTFIYNSASFNLFGFHPFGFERFGSSNDTSAKKKFRIYLNRSINPIPFYTAQLEFASDGENQQWEVTNFALRVRPYSQPEKPSLMRVFQ
jgi:hypothetical protein